MVPDPINSALLGVGLDAIIAVAAANVWMEVKKLRLVALALPLLMLDPTLASRFLKNLSRFE